jgi:uncharacterized protein
MASYMNPTAQGPIEGLNQLTYWYTHLFADMKMMSLFSMLFGAGMLLFIEKAKERRGKSIGLHHRRMLWLLVFGLIHAYFIWRGDILVVYAIGGVIIYWFKNASPTWLIITGVIFFLFLASIQLSLGVFWDVIPEEQLVEVIEIFQPEQETIDEEVAAYSGSFLETHKRRVIDAWDMHQSLFGFIWRVLANMLFGMALFKMGILKGEKSRKFYRNFMLLGFGIGFPLIAAGIVQNFANNWDPKFYFAYGFQYQLLRQHFRRLWLHRPDRALVQIRLPDGPEAPPGCGRAHGLHELHHAVDHLHDHFLRFRLRPVQPDRPLSAAVDRAGHLDLPTGHFALVAETLSLRPAGMAVENVDILETTAAA